MLQHEPHLPVMQPNGYKIRERSLTMAYFDNLPVMQPTFFFNKLLEYFLNMKAPIMFIITTRSRSLDENKEKIKIK
jgi:hypothetical protein